MVGLVLAGCGGDDTPPAQANTGAATVFDEDAGGDAYAGPAWDSDDDEWSEPSADGTSTTHSDSSSTSATTDSGSTNGSGSTGGRSTGSGSDGGSGSTGSGTDGGSVTTDGTGGTMTGTSSGTGGTSATAG